MEMFRELSEKMSLGALILETVNKDFWVTLGSMSSDLAFKQHSFIRALHLDMFLSEAWAYHGKAISSWQKKHLIEIEALILHWPCRGLEYRWKIITHLEVPQ
ncbi:unnamed protein product [Urochloa humidicola]